MSIAIRTGDAPELEAFLAQRIYEYNAVATGYHDGDSFAAVRESESGDVEAGASGYTWGGCCYIAYLWVSETLRGRGIGSELLRAVEAHAREKRCRVVFVSSHSFQAPAFYALHGYRQVAKVDDHPVGHSSIFLAKRLDT
jgi:ribosomal protein S18 acetylase RimI-like enzyme